MIWTLEYGGHFNSQKLKGYGLGKGWNKLEYEEREVGNVSGINLTKFYLSHSQLTVGVGDAKDRTFSWKYSVFCRKLPKSMCWYQIQIFQEMVCKAAQILGKQRGTKALQLWADKRRWVKQQDGPQDELVNHESRALKHKSKCFNKQRLVVKSQVRNNEANAARYT